MKENTDLAELCVIVSSVATNLLEDGQELLGPGFFLHFMLKCT